MFLVRLVGPLQCRVRRGDVTTSLEAWDGKTSVYPLVKMRILFEVDTREGCIKGMSIGVSKGDDDEEVKL